MRATRRRLLQFPLAVMLVSGCASSPVITGDPGDVPEPEPPTRSAEAAAVARWVAGLAAVVDELALTTQAWGADETGVAWLNALQEQSSAHVSRVVAADPVTGGPTAFPAPDAPALPTTPAVTSDEVLALLTKAVAAGTPILRAGFAAATSGPDRLFHASLAVAANASLVPALPPLAGGAGPAPFIGEDEPASLAVALGHARALISGLELGLGRLSPSNDLQAAGTERLTAAKRLRNTLIASLTGDLPEVDTRELPNAMATTAEILAAWALLELNLLQAFGALTAADESDTDAWLDAMLGQVPWVHRWGGRLPYWPGWVATS